MNPEDAFRFVANIVNQTPLTMEQNKQARDALISLSQLLNTYGESQTQDQSGQENT